MAEKTCGNCDHFHPFVEGAIGEGNCRRFPPQVQALGMTPDGRVLNQSFWPQTRSSEPACGEHKGSLLINGQ